MEQQELATLIEMFEKSSLTGLELTKDGTTLKLKREISTPQQIHYMTGAPVQQAAAPMPSAGAEAASHQNAPKKAEPADPNLITIPSPIVGTFYRTPAPDALPFVEIGDTLKQGSPLCIIEAMKMMNKLEAEFPCEVVSILAEHGDLVEYGQALFEVRRI